jgi:predicted nucleic acid-binding protein
MRGDMAGQNVAHLLRTAAAHYDRLIPIESIAAEAMALAISLKHPIYDCFYLALAERERAPLISADRRLLAVGKNVEGVKVRALEAL